MAERAGGKVESVEKYWLEAGQAGMLSLERDWMKTWPCKLSYTNTGEKREARRRTRLELFSDNDRVLASSSFNKIIVKTSTTRHRLLVVDMETGQTMYQVPIDMLVDHVVLFDGRIILLNANNLLLSVVLDYD